MATTTSDCSTTIYLLEFGLPETVFKKGEDENLGLPLYAFVFGHILEVAEWNLSALSSFNAGSELAGRHKWVHGSRS